MKLFSRKKKKENKLTIWEGISGYYHYHLSTGGQENVLCGDNKVMSTGLPLESWGFKSEHIPESYCKKCEGIAKSQGMIDETS